MKILTIEVNDDRNRAFETPEDARAEIEHIFKSLLEQINKMPLMHRGESCSHWIIDRSGKEVIGKFEFTSGTRSKEKAA